MTEDSSPDFEEVHQAFCDADLETLERLAGQGGFPHGLDAWLGRHWLTTAIGTAREDTVAWVLSKGVEVNYVDDEGATALKWALQMENEYKWQRPDITTSAQAAAMTINLINLLSEAGADLNLGGTLDETALHTAAMWSSVSVVQHLLSLGADPTVFDAEYTPQRPEDYAKFHKRTEVHAVLLEARTQAEAKAAALRDWPQF